MLDAAPSSVDALDPEEGTIAMAQRHQRILARLAEIGLEAAEALAADVVAKKISGVLAANTYVRLAQAIRRTMALEAHLSADVGGGGASLFAAQNTRQKGSQTELRSPKRRDIEEQTLAAIVRSDPDAKPENLARLVQDMGALLDAPEDFGDLTTRPVAETIARLCAALGIDPDISKWQVNGPAVRASPGPAAPKAPAPATPENPRTASLRNSTSLEPAAGRFALADPPRPLWKGAWKTVSPHPSP